MPMRKKIAVVTGTSRGIGEALGTALLDRDFRVYGISRSQSVRLEDREQFIGIACDLSDPLAVEDMANRLFRELSTAPCEELLLINNAGMLEPLMPIEAVDVHEMTTHLQTNLIAPMALCGAFVRHAQELPAEKRILNVTSGLAVYSASAMSLYCSSKAALNMLTRCIADEQKERTRPILAYALDPGMAETQLQVDARSRNGGDFPLQAYFQQSYEQGKLWTPERVADETLRMLESPHPNGAVLRVYEQSLHGIG